MKHHPDPSCTLYGCHLSPHIVQQQQQAAVRIHSSSRSAGRRKSTTSRMVGEETKSARAKSKGRPSSEQSMTTDVDPTPHGTEQHREEERQEQRHSFTTCRLLYATQSGRAKACARRVARLLQTHTPLAVPRPTSLDETLGVSLRQVVASWKADKKTQRTLLILFVSTTGDGEAPDNMRQTWTQW